LNLSEKRDKALTVFRFTLNTTNKKSHPMGEFKKAFHVRHPGKGRDPVCKMFLEETKKLSGSRPSPG